MNVYFVNCMLACLLAYVAGYYMAHRKFQQILARIYANAVVVRQADLSVGKSPNDTSIH